MLGVLALLTPTVLGAGHGAMQILLVSNPSWLLLTTTILLKVLASAISLGSGFRGGLFFASLMLGALIGQLYSVVLSGPFPTLALQPGTAAIAALAALGTGVLGAPFSMVCLALEITGDFSVTVGAVVASSVSALIVRELFGYSFATWRFHLRGEVIRGPQDVGWVKQLSATSLMRSDFENAPSTMPIAEAQKLFSSNRSCCVTPTAPTPGSSHRPTCIRLPPRTICRWRRWRSSARNSCFPTPAFATSWRRSSAPKPTFSPSSTAPITAPRSAPSAKRMYCAPTARSWNGAIRNCFFGERAVQGRRSMSIRMKSPR
jgi:hypothetical protein